VAPSSRKAHLSRLDAALVERGLADTLARARAEVVAGNVLVDEQPRSLPSSPVTPGAVIRLRTAPSPFVSRAGAKLHAALGTFGVDPAGRVCADLGASTGGFTDCLLQRGARQVVALDVGHGQLHPKLRSDPRVVVFERFHIRDATPATIGGIVDAVVADLSFISLTRVLDALVACCVAGGPMLLLVKPQFEAGRAEVSRGRGVVSDPQVHERVRQEVHDALVARGCVVHGWMESPLRGGHGNLELLVLARTAPPGCGT
jgi:23S rRNA (cytidine1920-2'-O)/16S rRNA (cytidine1409-2'-O)-methyltransferase